MKIVKDYFGDHYSYIAEERAKRPIELAPSINEVLHNPQACHFCPGNETQTPQEIGRIADMSGNWKIRWFPNKFPAISTDSEGASGFHEVIVETPDPQKQLWDFSSAELVELLSVYQNRIRDLAKDENIEYVCAIKNHGVDAGASIAHSHSQVIASSIPASRLIRTAKVSSACMYCQIIEVSTNRAIAQNTDIYPIVENQDFLLLSPRAPRLAMESWILAKDHTQNFLAFSPETLLSLAIGFDKILKKLRKLNASYSFSINFLSKARDAHFVMEILPRLSKWGGFELASGDYIIGVAPEAAAQFFRE